MSEEPQLLRLELLGGVHITRGGAVITDFRSRKTQALLAYLAVTGRPHPREALAGLLWGELPEESARGSLRQALANLARLVGEHLLITRTTVAFRPERAWLDVTAFQAALQPPATPAISAEPDLDHLRTAVGLYQGDFLGELSLPDAPAFDEWAAGQRERLRQLALHALHQLALHYTAQAEHTAAIDALTRLLTIEPWREEAHRHLMEVLAASGQRAAALAQYETCRRLLADELGVAPSPATTVLADRLRTGVVEAPAVRVAARSPRHNLPAPLTSFIGRARERAEITDLLATARLLTLVGPGGCGKTRLALETARQVLADYPDGVWLVALASLADPRLVVQAVAGVLGVREVPDRPLLATLRAALTNRRLLLVLDNCEHLLDACAHLAEDLLQSCPEVQVLATSREGLGLIGEVSYRVPSLAVPAPHQLTADLPLEELPRSEAVRLFMDRALAVQPRFALTAENAAAVVELCRRLDGIPLALELAAARVTTLTVEQLAARLDQRFQILTSGSRTALARQQTLRATMDWSYELLTPVEQVGFRRLAVFAGGWTLEAAEAVVGGQWAVGRDEGSGVRDQGPGDGLPPAEGETEISTVLGTRYSVLDVLARLVDKSLVQVEATAGGEPRYRLLETVRQYALERLAAAGDERAVRERHRDWFLRLAELAEPGLLEAEQVAWLGRLEVAHDNLRAALAWCLSHDPAAGLRLAGSLWPFWRLRSHYTEGRRWLETLLARTTERGVPRVKVLLGAGILARDQFDLPTAHARLSESLALSRALGEPRLIAWSLRDLGHLLIYLGDSAQARAVLEEGLALVRTTGDQRGLGANLLGLGSLLRSTGDFRRARALLEEGLAALRMVGDRWLLNGILRELGDLALVEGEIARAQALFEEALVLARELGSRRLLPALHYHLGWVALWQGELARAAGLYEAGLALAREITADEEIALNLAGLGWVQLTQGEAARAGALLQESLALFRKLDSKPGIGDVLCALGVATWSQGDVGRATALLRESLRLRQEIGERPGIGQCLVGLAIVAGDQGQALRATRLLGAAEAVLRSVAQPLSPFERSAYDRTVAAARASLGTTAFAAAWRAGQALTLEAACAEALADEDDAPLTPNPLSRAAGEGNSG
jgi:predicted ATPase/DNA-binding SARP family transcriptional activator